jgi:cell division septal protein FtsQ
VAVLLGVALAGVAVGTPRALRAVAASEVFRVSAVELEGERFLSLAEAAAAADIPREASVWDDPARWEAGLAAHPLVRTARVRRRLPGTLILVVEEREPVGLVATPTLEPVDAEGKILPLDPSAHALDLPLLNPGADVDGEAGASRAALAAETDHLQRVDPEFSARISELTRDDRGDWIARWGEPAVSFRFRSSVTARRLREGVLVLADATAEGDGSPPAAVDLRFAEQVVVRRAP